MAADGSRAPQPVTLGGVVLDRYRHICAFVNGRAEEDALLDPFVRQGIDGGDRLLYLVDPSESGQPVTRLRQLGYDAAQLLEQHRCEVRTWTDTYLRGGSFNPGAMLELLDGVPTAATEPRIRMVADMGWAADLDRVGDDLIEFEARANFIHARHEHIVVCAYDVGQVAVSASSWALRRRSPGSTVDDRVARSP